MGPRQRASEIIHGGIWEVMFHVKSCTICFHSIPICHNFIWKSQLFHATNNRCHRFFDSDLKGSFHFTTESGWFWCYKYNGQRNVCSSSFKFWVRLYFFLVLSCCVFLVFVLNSIPGHILKLQIQNPTLHTHAWFPGNGEEAFGELIHFI